MKRILSILVTICALCVLSVPALAGEEEEPPAWLFSEEERAAFAAAQEAAQDAAASQAPAESELDASPPAEPPQTSGNLNESAGSNHGANSEGHHAVLPVDTGADDQYPVGSYIDDWGNVWSPSGQLLSPGTTPASEPVAEDSLSSGLLDSAGDAPTLPVEADPPTWTVTDLRPKDSPAQLLAGLKALVNSIFGDYTPVMTSSVVTETAGNDTYQYLIETVAPGAAGVDYEWVAGVFLFGIMLYCLMKLLGGVLK